MSTTTENTATAAQTQGSTKENLAHKITTERIQSELRPYQRLTIEGKLPRNEPLNLIITEEKEDLNETIIFRGAGNQEIDLKRFASFYVSELSMDDVIETKEGKVLPLGKGTTVYDVIKERGLPKQFVVVEDEKNPIFQGCKPGFLEDQEKGEVRKHIWKEKGVDTTQEDFKLFVPRNKKTATDPENWREIKTTMVDLIW